MILKLTSSGSLTWQKTLGQAIKEIDIDSFGNAYATGWFSGTRDFDPGVGMFELTSAGDLDPFAAKLNSSGGFEWAASLAGDARELAYSIAANDAGKVVFTGFSNVGAIDLDPTAGTFVVTNTSTTAFVVTLSQPLPPVPTISINSVSKAEGRSGTTAFVFTVTLSEASAQTISVNYATADGTALGNGNDYNSLAGTLVFNPGETSKSITVLVKGDRSKESD